MKIRIITSAKMAYDINVASNDFEEVIKKILEQQYIKLSENVVLLTSSITEIQKR
ncbi:MAG: hypothetical protein IKR12_00740 [Clostridia bacterium]|nr:hypothetical protein [Clostridia bacterium]